MTRTFLACVTLFVAVAVSTATAAFIAPFPTPFTTTPSTSFSTPSTAVGKRAIAFTLEDQFEKEWTWDGHWRGKPTIIMMTDRKGKDYLQTWIKPLVASFRQTVRFASFADVSTVPGFLKGFIRGKFRDAFTTSILMDWEGTVIEHYMAKPDVPNVLFVDASGIVRLHTWGDGSGNAVQSFIEQVQRQLTP